MSSIAEYHYPIIRWKKREKLLWNPIHRKTLKNRPEERVRLRIIEALAEAGWSKHRISTEEPIRDYADSSLRTDIICYSQDFKPNILVECKAEHVALSEKAAEQIARYNRTIHAPLLLITNGREDHWFRINRDTESVRAMDQSPDMFSSEEDPQRDFAYWKDRGFAGAKARPRLRRWLSQVLNMFNDSQPDSIHYLQFEKTPTDINLNHYYLIGKAGERKIALTIVATSFSGTRMVAILNQDGANKAVMDINLDLLFEDEKPNSSVYSQSGIRNFDAGQAPLAGWFKEPVAESMDDLTVTLGEMFTNYNIS